MVSSVKPCTIIIIIIIPIINACVFESDWGFCMGLCIKPLKSCRTILYSLHIQRWNSGTAFLLPFWQVEMRPSFPWWTAHHSLVHLWGRRTVRGKAGMHQRQPWNAEQRGKRTRPTSALGQRGRDATILEAQTRRWRLGLLHNWRMYIPRKTHPSHWRRRLTQDKERMLGSTRLQTSIAPVPSVFLERPLTQRSRASVTIAQGCWGWSQAVGSPPCPSRVVTKWPAGPYWASREPFWATTCRGQSISPQ